MYETINSRWGCRRNKLYKAVFLFGVGTTSTLQHMLSCSFLGRIGHNSIGQHQGQDFSDSSWRGGGFMMHFDDPT